MTTPMTPPEPVELPPARPVPPVIIYALVAVAALTVIAAGLVAYVGDSTALTEVLGSLGTVLALLAAAARGQTVQATVNGLHGKLNGDLDRRITDAAARAVGVALARHDAGLQQLDDAKQLDAQKGDA